MRTEAHRTKDLTEGSPIRLLLLFSLPLMAGNIFQQLYTVVDTAIVGRVLGVDALAALGSADWLNWMTLSMVQGITQGFAILMAQKFGAGEYEKLRKVITNSIWLSVFCALVITVAGELAIHPVLLLLDTPDEISSIGSSYLRVLFAGLPVVTAYNLSACMLRSLGDSRTPLYAMVVASLTNIVLDLLFVVGFHWGVEGAAAATIIGQLVSVLYCTRKILKIEILHMKKEDWKMDGRLMGKLLVLGMPMAFQNSIIAVGGMIVQKVINGFGVAFIAGFTATNKLYGLLETAATSYGYAMVTYAGQNLGAGKKKRISQGMRSGLLISLLSSAVIAVFMISCGKIILGWFITADGETGIAALGIAYRYLWIMSVCLPILYVLHVTRSCIQGLGNTVLPMLSGVAEFCMRTGAALLLPGMMGENGIFFAEILAWIGADLILIPSYFLVMRKIKTGLVKNEK